MQIRELETHEDVPILEVSYDEPTFLTRATHRAQIEALLAVEAEHFGVIINFQNLSWSSQYGPKEQAETLSSPEFEELRNRSACVFRYHAHSLTTLITTLSAHHLVQAGACNFAPDQGSALRAARRAIDQELEKQRG